MHRQKPQQFHVVRMTLAVVNDLLSFLSQSSTNFNDIIQALFSSDAATTLYVSIALNLVHNFEIPTKNFRNCKGSRRNTRKYCLQDFMKIG